MKLIALLVLLMSACSLASAECVPAELSPELARIEATNREVRAAFKAGDVERIALFHHADVIKSVGPGRYFEGKEALKADLAETFAAVSLAFEEGPDDTSESLTVCGDTAIAITRFAIRWTPKNGDPGGVARGRSMFVLVKSQEAPHGWVTLREVIQPLP